MNIFENLWDNSISQARSSSARNRSIFTAGKTEKSEHPGGLISGTPLLHNVENQAPGALPLDVLLNEVSSSIDSATDSDPNTKNMDFSAVFKESFTPSPFEKTSSTLTPSIASKSISSVTKGVFETVTATEEFTPDEKTDLFGKLLEAVNTGFMNAESKLDSSISSDETVSQTLTDTHSLVRRNLDYYYSTALPEQESQKTPERPETATPEAIPMPPESAVPPARVANPDMLKIRENRVDVEMRPGGPEAAPANNIEKAPERSVKDNAIDARDSVFADPKLWQDKNMNGVSEAGDVPPLKNTGIDSLSVKYHNTDETGQQESRIRRLSTFTYTDGTTGNTADLWFMYQGASAYSKAQIIGAAL